MGEPVDIHLSGCKNRSLYWK